MRLVLTILAIGFLCVGIYSLVDFLTRVGYHYEGEVTISYDTYKSVQTGSNSKDSIYLLDNNMVKVYFDFSSYTDYSLLDSIKTIQSRWISNTPSILGAVVLPMIGVALFCISKEIREA